MQIYIVKAFTADGSGGNPAGVVLDADNLDETQMLAIAAKINLPETAFLCKSSVATHRVRFFTPTEEVNLCGHATIAAWSLLAQQGLAPGVYSQETLAGKLGITIRDDGLIFMEQAKPQFFEVVTREAVAPVLGLKPQDLVTDLQPQVASTGLRDLLVPVQNEDILNAIKPDMMAISALSRKYQITGLHVFCVLENEGSITAARNFSPLVGIPEEAATGTCSGALLAYLQAHNELGDTREYRMEQGRVMGELSYIYGKFDHDIVWIGGYAITIVTRA